jgi:hypothetical protein
MKRMRSIEVYLMNSVGVLGPTLLATRNINIRLVKKMVIAGTNGILVTGNGTAMELGPGQKHRYGTQMELVMREEG